MSVHDFIFGKERQVATVDDVMGEFRKYKAEAEAKIAELEGRVAAQPTASQEETQAAVDEIAQAVADFGGNELPAEQAARAPQEPQEPQTGEATPAEQEQATA